MRRVNILFQCIIAFFNATCIKVGSDFSRVTLPPVAVRKKSLGKDIFFLLSCSAFIGHAVGFVTGRRCFFRAYILASVMRKTGEDVELNVGMRNLAASSRSAGHCWVSLPDGSLLDEHGSFVEEYPVLMGCSKNGIRYWVGV
ncbi:MAG: lasso peptide biosynthesis protein [Kiritimatiellae bacterium]|nr:lasso peptide biosynthesis protein [Kiritimatiellia bacterium]